MNRWTKIKSIFAQLFQNCREASRALSQTIDHLLPLVKRLGLWLHLLICKWCRRYGKQIRFLRKAANENPEELADAAPQKLSSEARDVSSGDYWRKINVGVILQTYVRARMDVVKTTFESIRLLVSSPASYAMRLTRDTKEIRAAQSLRFEVFNLELNEGLEHS